MFPQDSASWLLLIAACVLGLAIGRWIGHRREKRVREQDALVRAAAGQKRRLSKKERLKQRHQRQAG